MFDSVQKAESRWKGLWPDVADMESARAASRQGMWAAILVAVVTGLVASFGLLGVDAWAFVDVAVFGAIAFGIYRLSRFAAVAGLLLFIIERVTMFSQTMSSGGILAIVLLLAFGNGARGSFAYHKLRKGSVDGGEGPVA